MEADGSIVLDCETALRDVGGRCLLIGVRRRGSDKQLLVTIDYKHLTVAKDAMRSSLPPVLLRDPTSALGLRVTGRVDVRHEAEIENTESIEDDRLSVHLLDRGRIVAELEPTKTRCKHTGARAVPAVDERVRFQKFDDCAVCSALRHRLPEREDIATSNPDEVEVGQVFRDSVSCSAK